MESECISFILFRKINSLLILLKQWERKNGLIVLKFSKEKILSENLVNVEIGKIYHYSDGLTI
jgi:hypothetical protein